jgi:KaiC/GvpD/RAD55 family RecA-like ATPase
MTYLKPNIKWLDELLPEGISIPSSTLVSGPGGTGKPLVEFAFVAAWLKAGGSIIGIPLQYPTGELVKTAMKKLYDMDLDNYRGKVVYIQFDPGVNGYEKTGKDTLKANMVKPQIWDETIEAAENMLDKTELGTMVFGSALNLLLFSKTYKISILNKLKEVLQYDKSRTYAFAVSTSAYADEIKILEEVADNLLFTRMEKPMKLFLKIDRMKNVRFSKKEKEVPISEEMLKEINQIAETTRKTRIPEIMNIEKPVNHLFMR